MLRKENKIDCFPEESVKQLDEHDERSAISNEIKDISWISKKTKQDLEPEGLRQVLFAINEFVEQKLQLQAEIIAELQLVAAYKEALVEKQVAFFKAYRD